MRKAHRSALALALCLATVCFALLFTAPSQGAADNVQTTDLMQDIIAYLHRCQSVPSSPPTALFRSCAKEKTELLRRQHNLHVSDAEVDAQLKGRGGFGRWP